MSKSIIFYTDNRLGGPIKSLVESYILKAGLPIVSCSIKPLDFGMNITINLEPKFITYLTQIVLALEASDSDYVFFCEHDVLYPKSHFDFTPPRDDIFYYNAHVWRWLVGDDHLITYDRLICLSGMCANRKLALDHFRKRLDKAKTMDQFDNPREPDWARMWGHEPGTKKIRRGGFSDDDYETWRSVDPVIDLRHQGTMTKIKVTLDSFKHQPINWQEIPIEKIPGWNLKKLFNL